MNAINQEYISFNAMYQAFKSISEKCFEPTDLTRNIPIVSMLSIEGNDIGMTSDRKRFASGFVGEIA